MSDDSALLNELRGLEELLTKPDIRRSPAALAQLIADDFTEFGSSGRVFNKEQIIAALQDQARCELSLTDFEVISLGADVVLATYRGKAQFSGAAAPAYSLRSSIWRRRNGKWEVVFHQGTPTVATSNQLNG